MDHHEPQFLGLYKYKVETLIKQQYKIHSCDPLYIVMISDDTTTNPKVKEITKKYMNKCKHES